MVSFGSKKEKRRFFAVASVGKGRWYWAVWPSLAEVQSSEEPLFLVGEGYEASKAEAVDRALELAGNDGEWIAAKYAEDYHRRQVIGTRRKANTTAGGGTSAPSKQEFLYRDMVDMESGQRISTAHRVVKRTDKYVFVEQQPYASNDLTGSLLDRERPTFRLDRQRLEQEGYAFIPASASLSDSEEPVFYASGRIPAFGSELFQCLQVLDLSWPCTPEEVKTAYRGLVRSAHPDGGGDHDRFLRLQEAYEQALQLCVQQGK
jgi:hypothetical protein